MLIIPVIDLMGGVVVRATGGRRDSYRPIISPLAASSAPCDIVAGFLRLHRFTVVYIADLDAILGRGGNMSAVRSLVDKFPEIAFWLDSGARSVAPESPVETIVGSETMRREAPPPDLSAEPRAILSLDFQNGNFLGPPPWPLAAAVACPSHRHDAGARGPRQWAGLRDIGRDQGASRRARAFRAGGVRGAEDLAALAGRGVAGALTASALHDGRLAPRDLARFAAQLQAVKGVNRGNFLRW